MRNLRRCIAYAIEQFQTQLTYASNCVEQFSAIFWIREKVRKKVCLTQRFRQSEMFCSSFINGKLEMHPFIGELTNVALATGAVHFNILI